MAYANSYTAATTDAFKKRVEMAVCRKAMTELGSPSSQADFDFARGILRNSAEVAADVAKAITSHSSMAAVVDADPTGAGITDAQIDTGVGVVLGLFAK